MERTHGEVLADLVEAEVNRKPGVSMRRFSCLMGCERACNVSVQSNGKLTYVLGRFDPDGAAAGAIADFAQFHSESPTGIVPFKQWPQGIKGHFIARIPVAPVNETGE